LVADQIDGWLESALRPLQAALAGRLAPADLDVVRAADGLVDALDTLDAILRARR
jgi:hypothetical protein